MTSGIKTTEFWLTILIGLTCATCAIITVVRGDIEAAKAFVGYAAGGGAVYTAARSAVKFRVDPVMAARSVPKV